MKNISKRIKGSVVVVLFLSIVTVFLLNVFGSGNFFVLASAHGANAETTVEGDTLDKEMSSDERVFVSTKEVCEGFVCAFFVL